MTGADRSPVWVERLVGKTNSVNQTPSPLVCLIISSRLGESMTTNTFVTRTAAATAHNSTIKPPIRQKTERNVRYNLPSVLTHDNRKFTLQTGIRACAAHHFCGKLELVIHCWYTINLWLYPLSESLYLGHLVIQLAKLLELDLAWGSLLVYPILHGCYSGPA